MEYEVKIKEFEGPLDLLLNLIKKEDISIFDISIDKITKQYLEYIEMMKNENLDVTSEYLVMAASLIEMKAKSLLPNKTNEEEEELEEDRNELIEKLIEYEKYKNVTSTFKELESIRMSVYTRNSEEILNYKNDNEIDYGINLDDLVQAMQKFLEKKELDKPLKTKIEKKEYSISKRCIEINKILKEKRKINFEELFDKLSKDYVIITFLAILTLAKKNELNIVQENNFQNIEIRVKE